MSANQFVYHYSWAKETVFQSEFGCYSERFVKFEAIVHHQQLQLHLMAELSQNQACADVENAVIWYLPFKPCTPNTDWVLCWMD